MSEEGESVEPADVVERRRSSEAAPYPRDAARPEKLNMSIKDRASYLHKGGYLRNEKAARCEKRGLWKTEVVVMIQGEV